MYATKKIAHLNDRDEVSDSTFQSIHEHLKHTLYNPTEIKIMAQ